VKDFFSSKVIAEVFSPVMIKKMSMLRIYPFKIGGITLGFIILFRVLHTAKLSEVDAKIKRLSYVVFEYIESIIDLDHNKNKYIDTIEHIYCRIEKEIMHAKIKNVPLSLALFSIKNYKRYYHLYGYDDVKQLLESFEMIIRNRLSDGDFSIRYDKNKIIMVLPGKNKKYAVPLANSIRNEVLKNFQKNDIQLLITFIIAGFPDDGNNIYSLLDTIE
jgi:GGDEF domain-containing protein